MACATDHLPDSQDHETPKNKAQSLDNECPLR